MFSFRVSVKQCCLFLPTVHADSLNSVFEFKHWSFEPDPCLAVNMETTSDVVGPEEVAYLKRERKFARRMLTSKCNTIERLLKSLVSSRRSIGILQGEAEEVLGRWQNATETIWRSIENDDEAEAETQAQEIYDLRFQNIKEQVEVYLLQRQDEPSSTGSIRLGASSNGDTEENSQTQEYITNTAQHHNSVEPVWPEEQTGARLPEQPINQQRSDQLIQVRLAAHQAQ